MEDLKVIVNFVRFKFWEAEQALPDMTYMNPQVITTLPSCLTPNYLTEKIVQKKEKNYKLK